MPLLLSSALLLSGGVYAAVAPPSPPTIPSADGSFTACYNKSSRLVRLIDPGNTTNRRDLCNARTEVQVTWSAAGPQGEAGPQGPAGPQGVPGPRGIGWLGEMVRNLPAHANITSTTPVDLNARGISHDKQQAGSLLRVTYQDLVTQEGAEPGDTGCKFRLLMDGVQVAAEQRVTLSAPASGPDPVTVNATLPAHLSWYIVGAAAGVHQFQVQGSRGNGAIKCHLALGNNGEFPSNDQVENSLTVEELIR